MLTKLQHYLKSNWLEALEVAVIAIGLPYYLYVIFLTFF
jgi:hypothetical protein